MTRKYNEPKKYFDFFFIIFSTKLTKLNILRLIYIYIYIERERERERERVINPLVANFCTIG
jgi:hypothetical protein